MKEHKALEAGILQGHWNLSLPCSYPSASPFKEQWIRPNKRLNWTGLLFCYSVVLGFRWSCAAADRIKIEEEKAGPLQTIKW